MRLYEHFQTDNCLSNLNILLSEEAPAWMREALGQSFLHTSAFGDDSDIHLLGLHVARAGMCELEYMNPAKSEDLIPIAQWIAKRFFAHRIWSDIWENSQGSQLAQMAQEANAENGVEPFTAAVEIILFSLWEYWDDAKNGKYSAES